MAGRSRIRNSEFRIWNFHPSIRAGFRISNFKFQICRREGRAIRDFRCVPRACTGKAEFRMSPCHGVAHSSKPDRPLPGFDIGGRALKDAPTKGTEDPVGGSFRARHHDDQIPKNLPARGARLCSPRGALPAPSADHNQPRMPFFTPTSRKVAAGPARRGFPRAGDSQSVFVGFG